MQAFQLLLLVAWSVQAIDVEVDCGPGVPCRLVHVLIDVSSKSSKLFLGGYRHKLSGQVHHHAITQTPKDPKYPKGTEAKLCRQTQTYDTSVTSCQTLREMGTQMMRPGVELDESGDR